MGFASSIYAQAVGDRVLLANLKVLHDQSIVAIDARGLNLGAAVPSFGSTIPWDMVVSVVFANDPTGDKASQTERWLVDVGRPLARLKTRLQAGADDQLEPLLELLARRPKPDDGALDRVEFFVAFAEMKRLIAAGRREEAAVAALRTIGAQQATGVDWSALPIPDAFDEATGLFADLAPVWLDPEAAGQQWPRAKETLALLGDAPPVGALLLAASLAGAAGEFNDARQLFDGLRSNDSEELAGVKALIEADWALRANRLEEAASRAGAARDQVSERFQTWLALTEGRIVRAAQKAGEDASAALLRLVQGPALHARRDRQLAAACLAEAAAIAERAGDLPSAKRMREELTREFAGTQAARLHASVKTGP